MRILACFGLLLVFAKGAAAGTVTGVVHNGTDGSLAAGVDVILIQLQGGMEPVANTKSDAKGNYKFDNPAIGQQPMLIRAVYHGVMFHQPLTPGRNTVDVTVFEPSTDPKIMNMGSRVIVFQPNGSMLLVGEEYALQNQSQPPKAYFSAKGDFEFQIPEGTQVSQVSANAVLRGNRRRRLIRVAARLEKSPYPSPGLVQRVVPLGAGVQHHAATRHFSEHGVQRRCVRPHEPRALPEPAAAARARSASTGSQSPVTSRTARPGALTPRLKSPQTGPPSPSAN